MDGTEATSRLHGDGDDNSRAGAMGGLRDNGSGEAMHGLHGGGVEVTSALHRDGSEEATHQLHGGGTEARLGCCVAMVVKKPRMGCSMAGNAKAVTLLHGDNNKYAVHWLCGGSTEGVGYTVMMLRRPHMDYAMMDDRWHQHCGRAHRDEVVQRIRGRVQAVEWFLLW